MTLRRRFCFLSCWASPTSSEDREASGGNRSKDFAIQRVMIPELHSLFPPRVVTHSTTLPRKRHSLRTRIFRWFVFSLNCFAVGVTFTLFRISPSLPQLRADRAHPAGDPDHGGHVRERDDGHGAAAGQRALAVHPPRLAEGVGGLWALNILLLSGVCRKLALLCRQRCCAGVGSL